MWYTIYQVVPPPLLWTEQYPDLSGSERKLYEIRKMFIFNLPSICRPSLEERWPGWPGTTPATARGSSAWGRASRWSCWTGWTPPRTTWWGWGCSWWRAWCLSPVCRSLLARPTSSPSRLTVKVGRGREPRAITLPVGYKPILMTDIILCSTKCKHIFKT